MVDLPVPDRQDLTWHQRLELRRVCLKGQPSCLLVSDFFIAILPSTSSTRQWSRARALDARSLRADRSR